jgi:hypothetical protein
MKNFILAATLIVAFLFLTVPAFADDLDDLLDYWWDWAEDYGYTVIYYDDGGDLDGDEYKYYTVELLPGTYHCYAESTDEGDDIDIFIIDEDGEEIISDTLDDNYPLVDFYLKHTESIEIQIEAYEYGSRHEYTEYVMVLATEDGGLADDSDFRDRHHNSLDADQVFVEDLMDEYMDIVDYEGYEMIFDDIDVVEEDYFMTYTITLGRGDYYLYAEGGLNIEDLDVYVYDERDREVASDDLEDVYCYLEFHVSESQDFTVEVEPYTMVSGEDEGYYLLVIARD